jgi:hypothetical protein
VPWRPSSSTRRPARRAVCLVAHVGDERLQPRGHVSEVSEQLAPLTPASSRRPQNSPRSRARFGPPGREALAVEQVPDPQTDARRLVAVGEADAAAGGADRARTLLGGGLDRLMVGQDEVRRGAHAESIAHRDPERFEPRHLLAQPAEVDDHAVPDQAAAARHHDPRGDQVEHDGLAVADDAVPGVGPALVAGDDVRPLAQGVHDLSLALVTPLGADHHRARHHDPPPVKTARHASRRHEVEQPADRTKQPGR